MSDRNTRCIKMVDNIPDEALELWLDDPTQSHPVFQAFMTILNAGADRVYDSKVWPEWVCGILMRAAYDRGMINEDYLKRLTLKILGVE